MRRLWQWVAGFCCMASLSAQEIHLPGRGHPDDIQEESKANEQAPEGKFYSEIFPQLPERRMLPDKDQILKVGMMVNLTAEQDLFKLINPYAVMNSGHMFVNVNIFEGLVVSQGFQILPGLAYQWEPSDDFKHWTFNLQPGARWSDGVEVRAQDFVLGWRTLCDPKTYSKEYFDLPKTVSRGSIKNVPIRNGMEIFEGRMPAEQLGVYAKDDKTLCFELERSILPELLLTSLTGYHFYPMRPEHVEIFCAKDMNRYARVPGCGAFALRGVQFPNSIYLKKNPFYWAKGRVFLQEIEFKLRRDYVMLKELWDGGEIDLYRVDREKVRLSKQQREHLWNVRKFAYEAIWLNHRHPWLCNKKVRQALNLLFHRERMIQAFLFGDTRTPLFGLLPPDSKVLKNARKSYKKQESGWNLLLEERKRQARALLDAGIEEEIVKSSQKDGTPPEDWFLKKERTRIHLMLQHAYDSTSSAIGILHHDLNLLSGLLEVRMLRTEVFPRYPQDMELSGAFLPPHPFYRFALFGTLKDPKGELQENEFGFYNQEYDDLLDTLESGAGIPESATQAQKWVDEKLCRLDQIVREELPVIPWRETMLQYVVHPEVGGLPRADYQESESTHHYSGVLYFKHLFIREPYDQPEHRCHSPKTGRKKRYFVFKREKRENGTRTGEG